MKWQFSKIWLKLILSRKIVLVGNTVRNRAHVPSSHIALITNLSALHVFLNYDSKATKYYPFFIYDMHCICTVAKKIDTFTYLKYIKRVVAIIAPKVITITKCIQVPPTS